MFLIDMFNNKTRLPDPKHALKGREDEQPTAATHAVTGRPLKGPFAAGCETIVLAMGCFWGAERLFWSLPGIAGTAAGYAGGYTKNPTHQEITTGLTGHAEAIRLDYDPATISLAEILRLFFEHHDPTQGMRQGQDIGTAYRSMILTTTEAQANTALSMRAAYDEALASAGRTDRITTTIGPLEQFYYASEHHQQYLARNSGATCAVRGTGISCPLPA